MPNIIRPAELADAPELAALIRDTSQFTRVNNEPPAATQEIVTRELALCLTGSAHGIWVCASEAGELLGYIAIHYLPYLIHSGPEGYISELFVRPAARGQGVGSALLARATEQARQRGCERLMLINLRNRESYQRGFYKKHGWEERENAANFVLALKP